MKRGVYIFWSIFVAIAIFRVWQSFGIEPPDIGDCIKQNVSGSGIVDEEPERKETGQVLIVSVRQLSVVNTNTLCGNGFLLRLKTKLYPEFDFGDEVSFKGKLLQPVNFDSGSDRSFDYINYLAKDDIFYEMKSAIVSLASSTTNTKIGLWNKSVSKLYWTKKEFVSSLEKTLGEPHAALASGLVVGEKAALGKDLLEDFRAVGLIHIIVLSGYNITIVADAMRRLLSFLPRVWGITIGGVGIALFGILVGGGATVVRSCMMASVALLADIIRRDYNVTNALIFAGLIMLIQNPMILLHDTSFQLSFLATLGLILLASPIEERLWFITDKFGIRGIIASSIATQIFVSPFILYIMGQISIIGIVVNILVLPFIPITMFFVFLTGTSGMIWLASAQLFGWVSHLLLSYELFMVQNFAKLPFASAHVGVFSIWWVVGFYVGFLLIYGWQRFMRKTKPSNSFVFGEEIKKPNKLPDLFEEFQKLPKSSLIEKPHDLVVTGFDTLMISRLLNTRFESIVFTRRTLKHLAEKGKEGKKLFDLISKIFLNPECIYIDSHSNRYAIVISLSNIKIGRYQVVVAERENAQLIIVTSFYTDEKYLKNFEILWRTGGSQL